MKIVKVQSSQSGIESAKEILYKNCDRKTVLFLSGGSTPRPLYETLVYEQKLHVGALAMVDDRYSLHEQYSNEFMIRESGLISFLESEKVPFYPILRYGLNRIQTASEYEKDVRFLFENYKRKVAILGVGPDGHTASISPCSNDLNHDIKQKLVIAVNDFPGEIKERITLTFKALSQMDYLIVLLFGKEKKKALEEMFKSGSIEEIPARFLAQNLSEKTVLITDQKV